MFGGDSHPSPFADILQQRFNTLDTEHLRLRVKDAERELYNSGITFTVYSDRDVIDRILLFDIIPWGHLGG